MNSYDVTSNGHIALVLAVNSWPSDVQNSPISLLRPYMEMRTRPAPQTSNWAEWRCSRGGEDPWLMMVLGWLEAAYMVVYDDYI